MKKILLILIAAFFAVLAARAVFAQELNAGNLMAVVENGDYGTYSLVTEKIYAAATNHKIKPTETDLMNVILYLGVLGSETKITATSGSQDYAKIRMKNALSLGEIGGNYARKCLIRMIYAEKDTASVVVVIACLKAMALLGNDDEYAAVKAVQYLYHYMKKKETGEVIESLIAFVVCVDALSKSTPFAVLANFGIVDDLKELINEDSRYTIYSPFVRSRAKGTLAGILAGAM